MVFPWFSQFSHGFRTVNERPAPPSSTTRWSWDRHGNRSAGSPVAAGFPWGFHYGTWGNIRKTVGKPWENADLTSKNWGNIGI